MTSVPFDQNSLHTAADAARVKGDLAVAADLFNQLGNRFLQENQLTEAIAAYKEALECVPDFDRAMSNLGVVYGKLDENEEALKWLGAACRQDPGKAFSLHNLVRQLQHMERLEEALERLLAFDRLNPENPLIMKDIATVYGHLGHHAESAACYKRILQIAPENVDYLTALAFELKELQQYDEALAQLDRADALVRENPNLLKPAVLVNRALVFLDLGRDEDALALLEHADSLFPWDDRVLTSLGIGLQDTHRFQEAIDLSERVLASGRRFPRVELIYSKSMYELGHLDRALEIIEEMLAVAHPEYNQARYQRAFLFLLLGRLQEGWADYEYRWKDDHYKKLRRMFSQPVWRGEKPEQIKGALLVTCEQGIGDQIQFARYLSVLTGLGYELLWEVDPALLSLFRESFEQPGVHIIPALEDPNRIEGDLPFAAYIGIFSLPLRLGLTEDTLPKTVPYLRVAEARSIAWAARLGPKKYPRVGLVWAGNPNHKRDRQRSMPIHFLEGLLSVQGVEFYSLQKERETGIEDFVWVQRLGSALENFEETGAALMNLDLLISIDTSIVHLAGALNRPVWLLLPAVPDWRWRLSGETSNWYTSMRIFRQHQLDDWESVVRDVSQALQDWAHLRAQQDRSSIGSNAGLI